MLYRDWDRFKDACTALCRDSDRQPRACIRWRHQVGLVVFRVTDDRKCLTFKTRSTTYLNRFDALNRALLRQFHNERRPSSPAPVGPSTSTSTSAGDLTDRAGPPPVAGAGAPSVGAAARGGGEVADEAAAAKAKKRRSKKKAK
ncbi:hypothetical protein JCM8208_006770 [Rhodotorula glutinis]